MPDFEVASHPCITDEDAALLRRNGIDRIPIKTDNDAIIELASALDGNTLVVAQVCELIKNLTTEVRVMRDAVTRLIARQGDR